MSEMIWTQIEIKIPTTWNGPEVPSPYQPGETHPTLPQVIADLSAYGWGDVSAEVDGDATVWTLADLQNYGMSSDEVTNILDWCEEHKVPYRAHDETKYEFGGETRIYDGKDGFWAFSNMGNDSSIVLNSGQWEAMVTKAEGVNAETADLVADFFAQDHAVEEFDIGHLPANPPVEVDA